MLPNVPTTWLSTAAQDVPHDPGRPSTLLCVRYDSWQMMRRNWYEFRRLEALGLTMYGQMTAGSWIYIGSQGIVQGTYETFAEAARMHFGGSLKGKFILTAGLGGMGGAQPLAVTMNEGVCLAVEMDASHIQRRLDTGYCDEMASTLDEALHQVREACDQKQPLSIGLIGNAAEIYPELVRRGVI